jgi:erythromycin esterase-like protein
MTTISKHILSSDNELLKEIIQANAQYLKTEDDLDDFIELVGNSRFVLLGESTHGTHEYYKWRMKITQRLIQEKGFTIIAVEGDWPDCYRINRYVKSYPDAHKNSLDVLRLFNRWPAWMWANWEMAAFMDWLKKYNNPLSQNQKVGFYGLDVYSFRESLIDIMNYLRKYDKNTYEIADRALMCFDAIEEEEGQSYSKTASYFTTLCEKEVNDLLHEIRENRHKYNSDPENVMSTEQNAWITVNAELYYRNMYKGGPNAWNIRDRHMLETIERLMDFHVEKSKIIIWAHNTHIGDARATDMADENMINIGQLLHEKYDKEGVIALGFGCYEGTVLAGSFWGSKVNNVNMPKARKNSWEYLLNESLNSDAVYIPLNEMKKNNLLNQPILHRAVGVVYNPENEKYGNYVPSIIPMRYDAFIYFKNTSPLHAIDSAIDEHQIPETYPFGF